MRKSTINQGHVRRGEKKPELDDPVNFLMKTNYANQV